LPRLRRRATKRKRTKAADHKFLQSLVGTYDAKVKFFMEPGKDPVEGKGTMNRKMILDGNYLQESFQGEFFGKPFKGMGIIGYDNNTKRYTNVWFDTMATTMSQLHGFYDADKKVFIMLGEDIDPETKKKMKARDVLKITGPDTQTFEMFRLVEGAKAEMQMMEITYTRKGGDKKVEKKDDKK
jgi:hypothetical protein